MKLISYAVLAGAIVIGFASCSKFEEKYTSIQTWELPMAGKYNCKTKLCRQRHNASKSPPMTYDTTWMPDAVIDIVRGSTVNTILVKGGNDTMAKYETQTIGDDIYRMSLTQNDSSFIWTVQYYKTKDSISITYLKQNQFSTSNRDTWIYNGKRVQ